MDERTIGTYTKMAGEYVKPLGRWYNIIYNVTFIYAKIVYQRE